MSEEGGVTLSEETVSRLSNGGNTDAGQRDSGYSVVSWSHRWPDTEPAITL